MITDQIVDLINPVDDVINTFKHLGNLKFQDAGKSYMKSLVGLTVTKRTLAPVATKILNPKTASVLVKGFNSFYQWYGTPFLAAKKATTAKVASTVINTPKAAAIVGGKALAITGGVALAHFGSHAVNALSPYDMYHMIFSKKLTPTQHKVVTSKIPWWQWFTPLAYQTVEARLFDPESRAAYAQSKKDKSIAEGGMQNGIQK